MAAAKKGKISQKNSMRLLELTNERIATTLQKHMEKEEVEAIRKLLSSLPKISQRIDEMKSRRSVIEKIQKMNEESVEPQFILNKWIDPETQKSLLFYAIDTKNLEIVKMFLQSGAKPNNIFTKDEVNAVTYACQVNADSKIIDQLMLHGGNPNIVGKLDESIGRSCLYYLAKYENIEGMRIILYETWKNPFEWKNFINMYDNNGYTIFLMCCKNNLTKSIKYLFNESNKRKKIKMDIYSKTQIEDKNSWFKGKIADKTGLLIACADNNTSLIKFLIREIYKKAEGLGNTTSIDESDEPYVGDGAATDDEATTSNKNKLDIDDASGDNENENENEDSDFKTEDIAITYEAPKSMDLFIVNIRDVKGWCPIYYAMIQDNMDICKYLYLQYYKKLDLNIFCETKESQYKNLQSLFYLAMTNNEIDLYLKWLLEKKTCDVNLKHTSHISKRQGCTPLMIAIELESLKYVNLLTQSKRVTILKPFDNNGYNAFDYTAIVGNIKIFRMLMLTLIERYNVINWDGIIKNEILTKNVFNKWIILAKDCGNIAFVSYIIDLERNAFNKESFSAFYSLINDKNDSLEMSNTNEMFENLSNMTQAARYLYDNCDKDVLSKFCKVINQGISTQSVGFDDSLLLLSKMVNNGEFIKCIEQTCLDCWGMSGQNNKNENDEKIDSNISGTQESKNNGGSENAQATEKRCYFNKYLANSRIWGMPVTDTSDLAALQSKNNADSSDDESSDDEDDNNDVFGGMNSNNNNNNRAKKKDVTINTLYDKLRHGKIEKEFEMQREFIKKKSTVHKQRFNLDWENVAKYELPENVSKSANEFMEQPIVAIDYKATQFPFDVLNNFNGKFEYESSNYLTKLLINARQVNSLFQKECQTFFESKDFGIECIFESLPPKTREECKNEWEYIADDESHLSFQENGLVTDMVRCRVLFENSKFLMNGIKKFEEYVMKAGGHMSAVAGNESDAAAAANEDKNKEHSNDNEKDQKEESKFSENTSRVNVIKSIVGLKNTYKGFEEVPELDFENHKLFYRDLRFNVSIVYNGAIIVGEVMFIAEYMLKAKNMFDSSVYNWMNNENYFNSINKLYLGSTKSKHYYYNSGNWDSLKYVILNKNLKVFYDMLSNCNRYDRMGFFLENETRINDLWNQKGCEWVQGKKLFELFMQKWAKDRGNSAESDDDVY